MGIFPFILIGLLPWLLIFGATVFLIHLWKKPGPDELQRSRVQELEDQVSLMREFLRDAMERIRRLEEAEGLRPLPPEVRRQVPGRPREGGQERRALPGSTGAPPERAVKDGADDERTEAGAPEVRSTEPPAG